MRSIIRKFTMTVAAVAMLLVLPANTSTAQEVTVSLGDLAGRPGDVVTLPINVSSLDGQGATSYQFDLTYDASVISLDSIGIEGTISENLQFVDGAQLSEGLFRVGGVSLDPMTGSGTLINVYGTLQTAGSGTVTPSGDFNAAQPPSTTFDPASSSVVASDFALSAPNVRAAIGGTVSLAFDIDDVTGEGVTAFQFDVLFDSAILEVTGISTEGTLSSQFASVDGEAIEEGRYRVGGFGIDPLEGEGTLVVVNANVLAAGTSALNLEDVSFNSGAVPVAGLPGQVAAVGAAYVQVIHNSPDAGTVDVYVNDGLALDDVPYQAASGYLSVPSGATKVDITASDAADNSSPVFTTTLTLPEGGEFVAIANGQVGDESFTLEAEEGRRVAEDDTQVEFTIFHGSPDAPAVDVNVLDETVEHSRILQLADDLAFGESTDYLAVDPAAYNVEVATADGETQVEVFRPDLSGLTGGTAVVVAEGFLNPGDGQPAFAVVAYLADGTRVEFGVVTSNEPGAGELPQEFRIRGNYPNPFNPSTTIHFDLPATAEVSISVIDLLGRNVMTVPAQTMQGGANQTVQLNASSLASGMYIYQVVAKTKAETLVKTGTMTLVK